MTKLDLHYTEPRLVDLYDIENPRGADTDFYVELAAELDARHILDLGCGTGLFTRELAMVDGRTVVGIDPASAMLAYAQLQSGAERVQWVEGTSKMLVTPQADLLIMTSHVAQVFLDDAEWDDTLQDIYNALRPGGYLAFESRNPEARGWERWNREDSFFRYGSPHGLMETWVEVVGVENSHFDSAQCRRVHFQGHNIFTATGEKLVVDSELRFRTLAELTSSLHNAGFTIAHLYGNWDHTPFVTTSPEMIFIARRN
ncbi:class I SAM-dependent methyltransferase [Candidatus Leptofilum sp.]|uniref:class I SAM-dependent methyltransferase n=1 Tax=Candidatus Leptofilum sp. TaxID=3241576 RepID=UPI003B5ADE70